MDNAKVTPRPHRVAIIFQLVRMQFLMDKANWKVTWFRVLFPPLYLFVYIGLGIWFNSIAGEELQSYEPQPTLTYINLPSTEVPIYVAGDSSVDSAALADAMAQVANSTLYNPNTNIVHTNYTSLEAFQDFCFESNNITAGVFYSSGSPAWEYKLFIPGQQVRSASSVVPADANYYHHAGNMANGLQATSQGAIFLESGLDANTSTAFWPFTQQLPVLSNYIRRDQWWLYYTPAVFIGLVMSQAMQTFMPKLVRANVDGYPKAYHLMGVSKFVYWVHFVVQLSVFGLASSLVTLLPVNFAYIAPASNSFLLLMSLWFGYIHHVVFGTLVAPLIKTKDGAGGVPFLFVLVNMAILVPFVLLFWPLPVYYVFTVLSPTLGVMLSFVIYAMYDFAGLRVGVQLGTAWDTGIGQLILCQMLGIALYLAISYSINGGRNIWHCKNKLPDLVEDFETPKIEPIPEDSDIAVEIKDLHKAFGTKRVLRGFDMQVKRGEVFGFLGANGAGKSVTCNLMGGEYTPDRGTITFKFVRKGDKPVSMEIQHDSTSEILRSAGYCMQHDTLIGELTGREQLTHCCHIKGGIPRTSPDQSVDDAIKAHVSDLIKQMNFTSEGDEDKPISTYSGGMKRKVSIAIALIGDPEMVFLDEPTAGVDPVGRHAIWSMIENAKANRSIVLTTHFMDEADVLSDRIGVINEGHMVACGTSLFLKNKFGVGFNLHYQRPSSTDEFPVAEEIPEAILKSTIVKQDTTTTGQDTDPLTTAHWIIPLEDQGKIPNLLRQLHEQEYHGITVELTTLEQVFLTIGSDSSQANYAKAGEDQQESAAEVDAALVKVWNSDIPDAEKCSKKNNLRLATYLMQRSVLTSGFGVWCVFVFPLIIMIVGFAVVFSVDSSSTSDTQTVIDPFFIDTNLLHYSEQPSDLPWTVFGLAEGVLSQPDINITSEVPMEPVEFVDDPMVRYLGGQMDQNVTTFFNTSRVHSISVLQGVYGNYSLAPLGEAISTEVVPIPYTQQASNTLTTTLMPILLGLAAFASAMLPVTILMMEEKKQIAVGRTYGLNYSDMVHGLVIGIVGAIVLMMVLITIVFGFSFKNPVMGNGGRWLATLLLEFVYMFAVTPMMLGLIRTFPNSEIAGMLLPGIFITIVVIPGSISSVFTGMDAARERMIKNILSFFLPTFGFQYCIIAIVSVSPLFNDPAVTWATVWEWENLVTSTLVFTALGGCCYWGLFELLLKHIERNQDLPPEGFPRLQDDDAAATDGSAAEKDVEADGSGGRGIGVEAEEKRAFESNDGIRVRHVSKTFMVKKNVKCKSIVTEKKAVQNVSFGVNANDVFILLGPNGAGKTSLCSTIVRNYPADTGGTVIAGMPDMTKKSFMKVLQDGKFGFVPQENVFYDTLSVKENFSMSARLRGFNVKSPCIQEHIKAVMHATGLLIHEKKKPKALSGGYQRRLCLGLALIGHPTALIADEMSSGVDPAARAHIHEMFKRGRVLGTKHNFTMPAMILSTHIMEEAKALATRIGIMVDGVLVASGTVQELSEQYCKYNYVEIVFDAALEAHPDFLTDLLAMLSENGVEATLVETQGNRALIRSEIKHDRSNVLQLADLYEWMETSQEKLHVKYYAVSVMDLEQVFIDIVAENSKDEDGEDGEDAVNASSRSLLKSQAHFSESLASDVVKDEPVKSVNPAGDKEDDNRASVLGVDEDDRESDKNSKGVEVEDAKVEVGSNEATTGGESEVAGGETEAVGGETEVAGNDATQENSP